MDDAVLRNLLGRLAKLEAEAVRYRQGRVTDVADLSVDLGGSGTAYTGVKSLENPRGLAVNDIVGALTFGNDMLVLGEVGEGQPAITRGIASVSITNGTSAQSNSIGHGLPSAPSSVVASAVVTGDGRDDYVATVGFADATIIRVSVRGAAAEQFPLANPTVVSFYWIAVA